MKRLLIIDNYDSFTYNLKQLIMGCFEGDVEVRRNDEVDLEYVRQGRFSALVISPGPGRPLNSGISTAAIESFCGVMPILGVCLGMQCINEAFGGRTVRSPEPMHGRTSVIIHDGSLLFRGVPERFRAARYHSLITEGSGEDIRITATDDKGLPMALEHRRLPLYGVQFHPESFMTEYGDIMMRNFLGTLQ